MSGIEKKAIEYVVESPKLLGFAVISYLSGHLWYFIISTYYKKTKKGNTLINNKYGKIAVGGFYNALIFYPFHLFINKSLMVNWEQMLDLILTTMLFSMTLQIIIFGLYIKFSKEV